MCFESWWMMYQLVLLFMEFFIFCVLGYIVEMITCFIAEHKLTNRGFLCGPVIPIYGVGALALLFLLAPFKQNPFLVFFLGLIITTSIEYLTSWGLEKIFHNKWWDYSNQKYNLQGRICLVNSLLFGIGSIIIIYFLGPWIRDFLIQIKDSVLYITALMIFIIFLIDVIYSCLVAYSLRNRLIIVEKLKNEKLSKIPGLLEQMLSKRLASIKGIKKYPNRLLKAFPNLKKLNQKEFDLMKKIALKEKSKKKKKHRKKKVSK